LGNKSSRTVKFGILGGLPLASGAASLYTFAIFEPALDMKLMRRSR
jgi:hypothetical protein